MKKQHRRNLQYLLIRILLLFFTILPRRLALWLAALLGRMAFLLLASPREKAISNLTLAYDKVKPPQEISHLAREAFQELGKNAVDLCLYGSINRGNFERLIRTEGIEHFDAAYRRGKGLVAITCHLGNWELIALYFALKGYPVSVIGRQVYDPRLNDILTTLRAGKGIRSLDRDRSARQVLQVLKAGEILGVLIDQDTSVDGVFVDFFGTPAYTPTGPIAMALRTGAPVIPLAIHRQPDDTFLLTIERPLELVRTGDRREDIRLNTQAVTTILERFIRAHPTQWVWIHDRWKTQLPIGDASPISR